MRLFVALTAPEVLRRAIWADTARLREAHLPVRWVRPEGLHLTLKFLGDVGDDREPAIAEALARATHGARPFGLALTALGVFPDLNRPRVIWVGLEPVPALELLQDAAERVLGELGFEPEGRPFHPHVTLGRATREARAGDFRRLGPLLDELKVTGEFVVSHLDLMESRLTPGGAIYSARRELPLSSEGAE